MQSIALAVNQTKVNIANLVADAELLVKAAENGKLSFRADATKHGGDFRRVVEGLNKTFETVVKPIYELSEILKQIAAGDLTVRISGEYLGELA